MELTSLLNSQVSGGSVGKTSVLRSWNRLSRFQRSLLYLFVISFFVLFIYYILFNNSQILSSKVNETQSKFIPSLDKIDLPKNKVQIVADIINSENNANEDIENEDFDDGAIKADSNQANEYIDDSISFKGPQNSRQKSVVKAFLHGWKGYKTYAWGHDHLKPISKTGQNWFGLGMTIIDGLDTLIIMNLKNEFKEATNWIESQLNFNINKDVNLFESTIRLLGGLLSVFHLSENPSFLEKAKDLGERLLGAFESPSGIPYADVNLENGKGHAPKWNPDSSTSEVTTLQLEFRDLSRCTADPIFENKSSSVSIKVHQLNKLNGLVPIFINAMSGTFRNSATITLGARGDSYYEYLLKQWIQTGKTLDYLKDDYVEAVSGIEKWLVQRTHPNGYLFIGEVQSDGQGFKAKMDELVCFLPGTLALGVGHGMPGSHMKLATELLRTCYQTFASQPTFLAPEITYFNTKSDSVKDFYVKRRDAHYLLRPETIESLWYMYYYTKDTMYQDWGWNIFQGIENYTRVAHGYTTIGNVMDVKDLRPKDLMETYFLAETLKYLYLLFSKSAELDLNKWVFNTEGHPLPIYPN